MDVENATLITGIRPKNHGKHKKKKRRRIVKDKLSRIRARGSASSQALRTGGDILQRALQASRSVVTIDTIDTIDIIDTKHSEENTSFSATATTFSSAFAEEKNIESENNDDDNDKDKDEDYYDDDYEDYEDYEDFEEDEDEDTNDKNVTPLPGATKKKTQSSFRASKKTASKALSMSMSSMPQAPRVSSFYSQVGASSMRNGGGRHSRGKKRCKRDSHDIKKNVGVVVATRPPLKQPEAETDAAAIARLTNDAEAAEVAQAAEGSRKKKSKPTQHPSTYININPKDKASPFAPSKHQRILTQATTRARKNAAIESGMDERDVADGVEQLNNRMRGFGSKAAALDEFNSLLDKRLYMFGGFGVKREKPGSGKRGWRNIWDATSILTGQKTVHARISRERRVAATTTVTRT